MPDINPASGFCPIEKAMGVVGSRNAMLTMREAFYGTTRFDDFTERVGMSAATAAANLKALTAAGLLERRPYQLHGARMRNEYVLTAAGTDLMPVLLGLFDWGAKHADGAAHLGLRHDDCGEAIEVQVTCAGGHRVRPEEVSITLIANKHKATGARSDHNDR